MHSSSFLAATQIKESAPAAPQWNTQQTRGAFHPWRFFVQEYEVTSCTTRYCTSVFTMTKISGHTFIAALSTPGQFRPVWNSRILGDIFRSSRAKPTQKLTIVRRQAWIFPM
jgi:hypothetical protein